jgi:hypothetical protein
MNENGIVIPNGKFDDRNINKDSLQTKKEISAPGKEIGRINAENLGQCIFSILGDVSKEGGLDLIMTDADNIPSKAISISKGLDDGYKINGSNIATIKKQMPNHEAELGKIVEDYLEELKGFGVTV